MLECDIESLSQGVGDAQYPHPHSHSSSHPWSQSLDKQPSSPSRHRLGRRVTLWEPDIELDPSERPYRGPWGHSFGIHPEDNNGISNFCQKAGNSTSPGDAHSLPRYWR